jgi:hypothetical protein
VTHLSKKSELDSGIVGNLTAIEIVRSVLFIISNLVRLIFCIKNVNVYKRRKRMLNN